MDQAAFALALAVAERVLELVIPWPLPLGCCDHRQVPADLVSFKFSLNSHG